MHLPVSLSGVSTKSAAVYAGWCAARTTITVAADVKTVASSALMAATVGAAVTVVGNAAEIVCQQAINRTAGVHETG